VKALQSIYANLPYEKLIPLPGKTRYIIYGCLALVLVGAFYFFYILGQDTEVERLNNKLATIEKDIRDNKQHADKEGKLRERIEQAKADLAIASRQLPTSREIPELLEQISYIGTQLGLEFLSFQPKGEVVRDYYAEVPVSIKVSGKFHNILMFYDELAHMPRIVTVGSIHLEKSKNPKAGEDPEAIVMSCSAITYRYVDPEEAAAIAKQNAAKQQGKGKKG
jgi:type IV pilus assembly protein PilO